MNNSQLLPLMMFGSSMLGQAGPQPYPRSFGGALGGALNAGAQGMLMGQEMDQRGRSNKLQELALIQQMNEMQRAAAQQMKREKALQGALKGMTPEDAALAQADPDTYFKAKTEARFRAPEKQPDWLDPRYIEAQKEIRAAGRPNISVSPQLINAAGETEAAKTLGKAQSERFIGMQGKGEQAANSLATIAYLKQLASQAGTGGGDMGAAAIDFGKRVQEAFGIDTNLDAREAFTAATNKLIKDELGSLGTAVSNADVQFVAKTAPQLGATLEGNMQILDWKEKAAKRQLEVARMATDWQGQYGSLYSRDENGQTFDQAMAGYAEANPLFATDSAATAPAAAPASATPSAADIEAELRRRGKLP